MSTPYRLFAWFIAGLNFGDAIASFAHENYYGFINFIIAVILVYVMGWADGRDYIV